MKNAFLFSVWIAASAATVSLAAQPGQTEETTPDAQTTGVDRSPTVSTTYRQRGRWLEQREAVTWFGPDNAYWYVTQSSRLEAVGDVLLVSDYDPNGASQLASMRSDLSRMGWRTHFVTLQDGDQMLNGLAEVLSPSARRFVMCEGNACFSLVAQLQALGPLQTQGLVFINLPLAAEVAASPLQTAQKLKAFVELPLASLVLQEFPNQWPLQQPLAADVELHLLPRASAGRSNSRVLRKFRGWLKRRHQIG